MKHKLISILFVSGILTGLAVGILSPIFSGNVSAYTTPEANARIVKELYSVCTRHKPFTVNEASSAVNKIKDGTTLKDAGVSSTDAKLVGPSAESSIDKETIYNYFYYKDYEDVSHNIHGNPCNVADQVVEYGDALNRNTAGDTTTLKNALADQKSNYTAAVFNDAVTNCPKIALAAANSASGGFTEANYETQLRKCLSSKLSGLPKTALDAAIAAIANPQGNQSELGTQCTVDQLLPDGSCPATNCTGTIGADGSCNSVSDPSDDPTCESSAGPLGWILCQLIDGMQNAIGGIYDHIIQPLLQTEPITTGNKTGNQIYKAWANFRVYGDVFLVIALLIIVFGESIGGGLVDAYTAKKVLPRLLVAAVLINISYYLVAILVDITNIVGKGLMTLITTPFGLTGDFTLDINKTGATTMALLLAGAVVWAKVSVGSQFIAWLFFSILLPLLLLFLSIMAVVLIRRALIVFLVIISPVAFALYCLPNTEKYFRKWWDILFETLLVYPIIASLFAMGKVSGYLINQSGGTNFLIDGLANILGIAALAVPLLLIPFSFKLAGGLMGRAYELASGARTKMNIGGASRERIKAQGARNRLQSRQKYHSKLQAAASKGDENTKAGRFRRATLGRALRGTGGLLGYNVEAEASAARAEVGKTINDQIATGRDEEIRGLTVNKKSSRWRMYDGRKQYESLGGAWIDEADVDKGHARWGNDTFAQQAALSYEMRKAQSEGQLQSLARNYRSVAQGPGGWGMDDQQAGGAWIGAAFERQNEHLEFKSTEWETGALKVDKDTGLAGGGLVDEVYEKKGSYPMAQMGSNTIEQLKNAHESAEAVLSDPSASAEAKMAALDQKGKIQAIAETFMHEAGSGQIGVGANDEPIVDSSGGRRQASTAGAAHVAERVRELAVLSGVYEKGPAGQYVKKDHAPTPNGREQK